MRNCYRNIHFKKNQRGKIVTSLLVILAILILGFIYLIQANSGVTKGYQISDYQKTLKQVNNTEQELQIQAAQWQSLPYLKELIDKLDMVKVEKISYLNMADEEVAAAE